MNRLYLEEDGDLDLNFVPFHEPKRLMPKKSIQKDRVRYFKIIDLDMNQTYGRFCGRTPKQAAQKAFTSLMRVNRIRGLPTSGNFHFAIKECTRGNVHRTFEYTGCQMLLEYPQQIQVINVHGIIEVITCRYWNVIKKCK